MATFLCPKGHESTESDYCSECGARMDGPPAAAVPAAATLAENCPECGAKREQHDVVFCEICGYNFATGAPGDLSAIPPPPPVPAEVLQPAAAPAQAASAAPPKGWLVHVSADQTPHQAGSPEAPADFAPFTILLQGPASLIGRRSVARAIFPEIDLSHDSAVSHRHALLQLDAAGVLLLRDIGASNGTQLNGATIEPLKDHPVAVGDVITLGHWSRLVVKAVE